MAEQAKVRSHPSTSPSTSRRCTDRTGMRIASRDSRLVRRLDISCSSVRRRRFRRRVLSERIALLLPHQCQAALHTWWCTHRHLVVDIIVVRRPVWVADVEGFEAWAKVHILQLEGCRDWSPCICWRLPLATPSIRGYLRIAVVVIRLDRGRLDTRHTMGDKKRSCWCNHLRARAQPPTAGGSSRDQPGRILEDRWRCLLSGRPFLAKLLHNW